MPPSVTKLFAFATTAESLAATTTTNTTLTYDAATGNPVGTLKARISGCNKGPESPYWEWTGTWEALGVPAGATVDLVRLNAAASRCTVYTTGVASTNGSYTLRDDTGTTQATLP